jgi:hypothetical protein
MAALGEVHGSGLDFANESEFKHELFYRLHNRRLVGQPMGVQSPGSATSMLHSEARVQESSASKADILICDPGIQETFNYKAVFVVEAKVRVTLSELNKELEKFSRYAPPPIALYLVSQLPPTVSHQQAAELASRFGISKQWGGVIGPRDVKADSPKAHGKDFSHPRFVSALNEALVLYGNSRRQFQGFYWCNYQHELAKGWTFPCEGDFNAQLYTRLRTTFGPHAVARTEFQPGSSRKRVDFLIQSARASLAVEIKMNWDQFKPKYKKGVLLASEAETITAKMRGLAGLTERHRNALVVIQGIDGHKSNHKALALQSLKASDVPIDLYYYDEVRRAPVGPINLGGEAK